MSNTKFGIVLALFAVVLMFAIYLDTNIVSTKTITFEDQILECVEVKYTESDPDFICFGDKPLFWGITYYAPIIAIYEDNYIGM